MEKVKENKSKDHKDPISDKPTGKMQNCLEFCSDKENCLSLNDILRSFNAPLSEEQAWSLIYQSVLLYRNFIRIEFIDKHTIKDNNQKSTHRIKVPKSTRNLNVHKDGSVHIRDNGEFEKSILCGHGVKTCVASNRYSLFWDATSFGLTFLRSKVLCLLIAAERRRRDSIIDSF